MTGFIRALGAGLLAVCLCMAGDRVAIAAGRPVILTSTDGTPLAGTLYEASTRPAPAVVLVHMLNRSKEEWTNVADNLQSAGVTALAIDLRGHGASSGSSAQLPPMIGDVRAAVSWLAARNGVRSDRLALVGASLGANLAAIVAAEEPIVRAVAMLSPSLDYRGLRIDASVIKRLDNRPLWLASSTQDPYALRTIRELAAGSAPREQRLLGGLAHGTNLLVSDFDLARSLVDWVQRTLVF